MALISKKIENLLQYRFKAEEQSSRIYKAMGTWLDIKGYVGAAKLWNKYSAEEMEHSDWARKYLADLNIQTIIPNQEEPENSFKSLPQIIALSYKHELKITEECKELAKVCMEEQDFMTFVLAQKFMNEQVEEIAKLQLFIDYLETFGDSPVSLQLLDQKMGGY